MERLPMRYRIVVWLSGVACFAGLGGWSAVCLAAAATAAGTLVHEAVIGGALGALLGGLLVVGFIRALEAPDDESATAPSH